LCREPGTEAEREEQRREEAARQEAARAAAEAEEGAGRLVVEAEERADPGPRWRGRVKEDWWGQLFSQPTQPL